MRSASAGPTIRAGWLSGAAYAGMFGFGIVMALLGAILPLISERVHFDLAHAGNLFLAMNGAMLATTLALGPALDRFGMKPAMVVAPVFVAASLALITAAGTFPALLTAVILLGIGGGALNQATNTLIANLHSDENTKSAALNLLGVFFGFGALFIPFTIGVLLQALGLNHILYIAVVLVVAPATASIALVFPPPEQKSGVPVVQVLRYAREPLVLAFAFLLLFESGNEFILGGYITTFLTRRLGADVATASYLLAGYWGALMLGRIVLSRVLLRVRGEMLILASALGVAVSVTLLILSPSIGLGAAATILLGLSMAAIFPTVLGLAGSRYPRHSGTIFGILIGVALVGGMTLPWFAGLVSQTRGVTAGLSIAIVDALCIWGLQMVASRIWRRSAT
jgi:FHS family glucose/mannose:H+ symporter-like MFS transporter